MPPVLLAFILSALAGLSTILGALLVFHTGADNHKFLSFSMGLSAGVMIHVSFLEMLPQSLASFAAVTTPRQAQFWMILGFFGGFFLMAFIDMVIPETENPHHIQSAEEVMQESTVFCDLRRIGLLCALAIAIHNFPEGIATFMSTLLEPKLGISIALAVALHNIPEGISVAAPIYHCTGSKRQAMLYTIISGLAEPLGALLVYLFLMPFINATVLGVVFTIVAGIMIYISLDELLPASRAYGHHHLSLIGLFCGMLIMAISLLFL